MVIVSSIVYSAESTKEIAGRFLEAPAIPDFMIRRVPYLKSDLEKGIMSLSLYELDDARFAEGRRFISKYDTIFLGVPGFKYKIEPYLETAEALGLIGMGPNHATHGRGT